MSAWTLLEDTTGVLWGLPDGEPLAYELENGEPCWDTGRSITAEWHARAQIVARMDDTTLVERVHEGGSSSREYFDGLAAAGA